MLTDSLNLFEGSFITNLTVASGTSFPINPNAGELFYRTDADPAIAGLHTFNPTAADWSRVSTAQELVSPSGTSFPSNPLPGQLFFLDSNGTSEGLYYYDADTSSWLRSSSHAVINRGSSNPVSADDGELFFNSTSNTLQIWNGTTWEIAGDGLGNGGVLSANAGLPSALTTRFPYVIGDLYIDTDTSKIYYYHTSGWITDSPARSFPMGSYASLINPINGWYGVTGKDGGANVAYASDTNQILVYNPNTALAYNFSSDISVTAGTFNVLTIDNRGRVTSGSFVDPTVTISGDISGTNTLSNTISLTLPSVNSNVGTFNNVTVNAKGQVTAASQVNYLTPTSGFTITGAVTGSGDQSGGIVTQLSDVNSNVGTYAGLTVNAKGLVTAAASLSTLAEYGITDAITSNALTTHTTDNTIHLTSAQNTLLDGLSASLTASEVNYLVGVTSSIQTQLNNKQPSGVYLIGSSAFNITGDVTGTGNQNTGIDLTLNTVNSNVGAYSGLTINAKGLVTAATALTTLAGYGITDAAPLSHVGAAGSAHPLATDSANGFMSAADKATFDVMANYNSGVLSNIQAQLNGKQSISGGTIGGNIVMPTGTMITIVDAPVASTDAVNKGYVDSKIAGLTWKNAVKVATTTNITLSGTQTIDGVAVLVSNRILVKDQTDTTENGIYVVSAGAWSRATDMDQTTPLNELNSAAVFVERGTLYADTGWTQMHSVDTLGTDPVVFVQFSGAANVTAGVGLSITGNQLDINLGAGIAQLPTDEVGLDLFASGGLMTTLDGTAVSTSTGAQLSLTKVGTPGTYKSVTTDAYGRITAGGALVAADIPALDASKITTGTLTVGTSGNAATATLASSLTGGSITTGANSTTVGSTSASNVIISGSVANSAVITFSRFATYSVNMGLDTDNIFRLGGYSDGASIYRWTSDVSGNFVARGDITAFSDKRIKTDLKVIHDAVYKVGKLTGYTYKRIDNDALQTGLLAQDVQAILPEAVHTDKDGMLSLAYGNLMGLMVEAIKELKAEIEMLKAKK